MTLAIRIVLALTVGLGFAAAGEAILRRRSRGLAEANAALVAGMGACAAALFPLTLLSPRHALDVELFALAAAVVLAAARRLRRYRADTALEPAAAAGAATGPLLLAALAFVGFAAVDLRYNLLWDGFAIWTSKAQLLFVQGGLSRGWYPGETYDMRYAAYPALVPLYQALVARLLGRFEFDAFKPVFLVFHASLAVAVFAAVRARASARLAAWASALVLFVPALSTRWAAGGYADLPQAAVVAGVVAAGMREDATALPWLVGALTTVKQEGGVLAGLAVAAVAATGWRSLRAASGRGAVVLRFALIVAAFAAARLGYQRWTHVPDDVYAFQSVGVALERVPQVARLCFRELIDPRAWGVLWPAFLASGVVLLRRGSSAEKALAAAVAVAVAAMAAPFLFTTWPIELHVVQAYSRLLAQLAPAAVVTIVLGYARAAAVFAS